MEQITAIFGRETVEAVASGDTVSDKRDREVVRLAMEQSWRWAPLGPDRQELIIGDEQWPFPVPLAKSGDQWVFDSEAGKQEVIARRIGRNELGVIDLCRWYVDVQKEYAARAARRETGWAIRPAPAQHSRAPGWALLGDESRREAQPAGRSGCGSGGGGLCKESGRRLAVLGLPVSYPYGTRRAAPGGKKNYVVNGDMPGGFALVAYPARYGSSGVMTFIVNQDGVVYQKDLGKDTLSLAANMTEYNPDNSWESVQMP